MACPNKITESIINSCHPVKGVEPIIYWGYRQNLAFTFVDNTITAITAAPLGRIEVKKFGVNAGHEVVSVENQNNRFKHKLDTVLNSASDIIDDMDDVVFFVKENGVTAWKVYGAKYGCWKESQAAMANDNLGTIAVAFASREGMEEEFECYNTSIDIAALPNMENFDLIYGGTIANGGAVKLDVGNGKVGYIKLPNGSVLTSNGSGIINTTYSGISGAITYFIPKDKTKIDIAYSSLEGNAICNGVLVGSDFEARSCDKLVSFEANVTTTLVVRDQVPLSANILQRAVNHLGSVDVNDSPLCTEVIAPKATYVGAINCALTAKSIGDILYAAYIEQRLDVYYNFNGGTSAYDVEIDDYLVAEYGVAFVDVIAALEADSGDITYNIFV